MKLAVVAVAAAAACAGAQSRGPGCAAPAERVEVQQVQVGWQRLDRNLQRPVVDPRITSRDPEQAEALAKDILARCRDGESMERLQDRYSEAHSGSVVVGRRANVPFRSAALCLQRNECALVRSNVAFHVLKRIG
jgi:hypothetical protein